MRGATDVTDYPLAVKVAMAEVAQAVLLARYAAPAGQPRPYRGSRRWSAPDPTPWQPKPIPANRRRFRSDVRTAMITEAGHRCFWCRRVGNLAVDPDGRTWHLDHRVPLFRGGPDERRNLVVACARCNLTRREGNRTGRRGD